MLTIRREQMDALGEASVDGRSDALALDLRADFAEELAQLSDSELKSRVRALVNQFRGYGYSKYPYICRLVAWGLFYGDDYVRELGAGELDAICRQALDEDARYAAFEKVLLQPGYVDAGQFDPVTSK